MKQIIGFGSAVIDVLIKTTDKEIDELGFQKGRSQKTDRTNIENIINKFPNKTIMSGGSSSNIIHTMGFLGYDTLFHLFCGNNEYSNLFEKQMPYTKIEKHVIGEKGSVICLCLITPDGQRTMAWCPAEKKENKRINLNDGLILIDGYNALSHDYSNNVEKIICFSDIGCVKNFKEKNIIDDAKIIIGNLEEFEEFYGLQKNELFEELKNKKEVFAITDGKNGSYAISENKIFYQPVRNVDVVDTTGAGDSWTGGFLYSYLKYNDLERATKLATKVSSIIVTKIGARL